MLVFSIVCLLKAREFLPMVPVDGMPGVFKTQNPPPKIVGFGNDAKEAGLYAYTLDKYQKGPSSGKAISVNPFGKFNISSYEQVTGGWMLRHKDMGGQDFISYIVSTTKNWFDLQKTIDDTLQRYMPKFPKRIYLCLKKVRRYKGLGLNLARIHRYNYTYEQSTSRTYGVSCALYKQEDGSNVRL